MAIECISVPVKRRKIGDHTGCCAPDCESRARNFSLHEPMCNKHWQRQVKYGSYNNPFKEVGEWKACSIIGCEKRSRTRFGAHCEMHYYRRYLRGTFAESEKKPRRPTSHGYMLVSKVGHYLAGKSGFFYEHRLVLFEKIGLGPHNCHWCNPEESSILKPENLATSVF